MPFTFIRATHWGIMLGKAHFRLGGVEFQLWQYLLFFRIRRARVEIRGKKAKVRWVRESFSLHSHAQHGRDLE